eukprot:350390-Chlamydomonas_euryale.AAC.6
MKSIIDPVSHGPWAQFPMDHGPSFPWTMSPVFHGPWAQFWGVRCPAAAHLHAHALARARRHDHEVIVAGERRSDHISLHASERRMAPVLLQHCERAHRQGVRAACVRHGLWLAPLPPLRDGLCVVRRLLLRPHLLYRLLQALTKAASAAGAAGRATSMWSASMRAAAMQAASMRAATVRLRSAAVHVALGRCCRRACSRTEHALLGRAAGSWPESAPRADSLGSPRPRAHAAPAVGLGRRRRLSAVVTNRAACALANKPRSVGWPRQGTRRRSGSALLGRWSIFGAADDRAERAAGREAKEARSARGETGRMGRRAGRVQICMGPHVPCRCSSQLGVDPTWVHPPPPTPTPRTRLRLDARIAIQMRGRKRCVLSARVDVLGSTAGVPVGMHAYGVRKCVRQPSSSPGPRPVRHLRGHSLGGMHGGKTCSAACRS